MENASGKINGCDEFGGARYPIVECLYIVTIMSKAASSKGFTSMNDYANPSEYWETRLNCQFDLTGVGYAGVGEYYNAQMYQARLRAFERMLSHAGRHLQGASVLDIGCGTGFYTEYCKRQSVELYMGIDITEISIRTLRDRYPDFRFLQADITSDDFNISMGFDMVIAADVLYHIIDDGKFAIALRKLCGSVKPGGLLVIADVFPTNTVQTSAHVRLRGQREYEFPLRRAGLSVERIEPIFVVLQPPIDFRQAFWGNRVYNLAWKIMLRLIAWRPMEMIWVLSLAWLDERIFLNRINPRTYTVKWLLASDHHAE